MMKTLILFFSSLVVACGGTVVDIDGGSDSGSDAKKDVDCIDCVADSGGPFSCGKSICYDSQICIHGCCGGAMICAPFEDAGTCPQGMSISQQCPPQEPCTNICTPPEPYCGTVKDCSMPQGHDCYLLCQ